MSETLTTDEFNDLVELYENELRASITCAVDGTYYRKNDLVAAQDALYAAFDAQAERIAELETALIDIGSWTQELQDEIEEQGTCILCWRGCVAIARRALSGKTWIQEFQEKIAQLRTTTKKAHDD